MNEKGVRGGGTNLVMIIKSLIHLNTWSATFILLIDSQFLHPGSRGNTPEITFPDCHRDENSSFVEHLSWTWFPPLSFSTTDELAAVPAAKTTGISNIA